MNIQQLLLNLVLLSTYSATQIAAMQSTISRLKTFQLELLVEELELSALVKPSSYTSLIDLEMTEDERNGTGHEENI